VSELCSVWIHPKRIHKNSPFRRADREWNMSYAADRRWEFEYCKGSYLHGCCDRTIRYVL